jgi:membrane fusion protein (multidrug efflux system)
MHQIGRWSSRIPVACVIALLASGCGSKDNSSQSAQGGADAPVNVTAIRVISKPLSVVLNTVGRTEGSKEVELRARVSGILKKRVYTEGAAVKAGAVMFEIDPAPFQIALEHARAALAGEQARNQQARRNADRLRELVGQHLVSRSDVDNAVSTLESSEAAILAAQADVREAELNLSYTKVIAPISGIAGRAFHSEGSLVTAGTDSSLLTTVSQTNPLWVRFALSESEYDSLRALNPSNKNSPLTVSLLHKDGSPYPARGQLNFAGSNVDAALGTVQLRAEFPNPDLSLLPGEYVQVRLSGAAEPGISVPQSAVLQGNNGPFVWVVNGLSQAEQRVVKTGDWVGAEWRIKSGLADGDTVIVDNLLKLRPNTVVKATTPVTQQASAPVPPEASSSR